MSRFGICSTSTFSDRHHSLSIVGPIAYHGVGEFIEVGNSNARHLAELIVKVKANPNCLNKARWFQKILGRTHGLDVAADIIERAFGERVENKERVAAMSLSAGIQITSAPSLRLV